MRLQFNQNITGYPFEFVCLTCHALKSSTGGYVADLDGEPFNAYYCIPCGNTKQILHDRTKGA